MTIRGPELVFVKDLRDRYETRFQHARSTGSGAERRVSRGVYIPTSAWDALSEDERYFARVRAVAETRRNRPVLSHWSAAVVHHLPNCRPWPNAVDTTVAAPGSGRSRNGVVVHVSALPDEDVVEVDGLLVTSLERTIVDVATRGDFLCATAMADRAIHIDRRGLIAPWTTKAALYKQWEKSIPFRGYARARDIIDFSVELADSALESVSRVNMRVIGCPKPLLQSAFSDYRGYIGECDFDWPEHKLIGEADGVVKYLSERYRRGRTPEQVMLDEKYREDRLRALGRAVTRWPWSIGVDPGALRRHLVDAGLPMGIRW